MLQLTHNRKVSNITVHNNTVNYNSGFVILFAVVISSIIALIGAGIFSIAFKESILASTASESQVARFAADSGMECTLFRELKQTISSPTLTCAGPNSITPTLSTPSMTNNTGAVNLSTEPDYEFRFAFDGMTSCGYVTVTHNQLPPSSVNSGATVIYGTLIISRGYNVCIGDMPNSQSQFLVERRLEAWYPNPSVASVPNTNTNTNTNTNPNTNTNTGPNTNPNTGPNTS